MPNQIQATGTLANPPNPLFLFNPDGIRQHDGLYCLNDLHKMAGGKIKDTPSRFIILAKTQSQIQAFERLAQIHNPKKGSDLSPVIRVINGGATMSKAHQRGKDKGHNALYFPKWYLCTNATPTRSQRQISMIKGVK